ncbi:MAG: thymidylate synthase [Candidatus Magasanikbacteria bacterium]|nr:thymidylate synthase [Candidatus Magasanikbacteria bacterium]MCA9391070.1 thymidylate synthase [Candidatus Magasanikbacteria bacterium]USN52567.1 MAG: thymidylate synthase [Candidatus Nomurabacteria bacterium]
MTTPTSEYHRIIEDVLNTGSLEPNRTGVSAVKIAGASFTCDASLGFPAITTKKLFFESMAVELEGFINGITDKQWYQNRKCYIWNQWCRADIIPPELKADRMKKEKDAFQLNERDLGPVYGFQWRHWNAEYNGHLADYTGMGIDQLKNAIDAMRRDPSNRRVIVMAWNPSQLDMMALPACHTSFQLTTIGGKLNLLWSQRSCDLMLGIPFNIASYALLQHLIARDLGMPVGRLVGHLNDVHIYENHLEGAREQLSRDPERHQPPTIVTTGESTSIFDWDHTMTKLVGYEHDPAIKMEVAI